LYAIGLAQDLQWTSDVEQEKAWWNDDEYRDAAKIIRARSMASAADNRCIITIEVSSSPA
jgi:hypothetical protein